MRAGIAKGKVKSHMELESSLYGQVANILGRRIVGGSFKPGEAMPNTDALRDEFKVSRTVLREAGKLLEGKGLVLPRPRVGMSVRPRSNWSLMDRDVFLWCVETGIDTVLLREIIDLRTMIEPGAAKIATRHAHDDELAKLGDLFDDLQTHVGTPEDFIDADIRLHLYILSLTHNEIAEQTSLILHAAIRTIALCTTIVPGSSASSMPIHHEVVEALMARDGKRALTAMSELVDGASEGIDRFLELPADEIESRLERASLEVGKILRNETL